MLIVIIYASLLTIVMWLPYFIAWVPTKGVGLLLSGNPKPVTKFETPDWSNRLQQAHQNAIENLPAFIGVCMALELSGKTNDLLNNIAWLYVISRIVHYFCYGLAIPLLRTVAFMTGWGVTIYLGAQVIF
ncbi:MAG: MAPEG family protein [Kangiellaceae bacterium]|nr:MAPEG family protein [Kangiellaceae bacterium]